MVVFHPFVNVVLLSLSLSLSLLLIIRNVDSMRIPLNIVAGQVRRASTKNKKYYYSTFRTSFVSSSTAFYDPLQTKNSFDRKKFSPNPLFSSSSSSNTYQSRGVSTESGLSELELFEWLKNQQSGGSSSIEGKNKYRVLRELLPKMNPKTQKEYTLYEQCVRRLYLTNLFHPVKMGLTNMQRLDAELHHPLQSTNVIHVAGTNGKGSVCYKLAKTLQTAGYKVGLFVSPHISSFRERMQINGQMISEQEVEELLPQIYDICESRDIPATFFEVTTALAFLYFHTRHVDFVVLETGLGGRLDATNILSQPLLTVITSIGLEHTRILGDTIELIAKEKAGIMKQNVPVVVGPNVPHDVLQQCAIEKQTQGYYPTTPSTTINSDAAVVDYNEENNDIVRTSIQILQQLHTDSISQLSSQHLEIGLSVRPPCRFEQLTIKNNNNNNNDQSILLDVAHNPDAIQLLLSKLATTTTTTTKIRMIVGLSSDKDVSQCIPAIQTFLQKHNNQMNGPYLHLVEAAHPRAAKIEDLINSCGTTKEYHVNLQDRSVTYQVQHALSLCEDDELLVICGSVFLMAEAREALGIDEPKDSQYISEVAGMNLRFGQENFANHKPTEPNTNK